MHARRKRTARTFLGFHPDIEPYENPDTRANRLRPMSADQSWYGLGITSKCEGIGFESRCRRTLGFAVTEDEVLAGRTAVRVRAGVEVEVEVVAPSAAR
jgi:hypothetical protein